MEHLDTGYKLSQLDPLVHEPARLRILSFLASVERIEFAALRRITDMTDGNLSAHIGRLERGDLVGVDRQIVGKRMLTTIRLTSAGRTALEQHWRNLDELHQLLTPSYQFRRTDAPLS